MSVSLLIIVYLPMPLHSTAFVIEKPINNLDLYMSVVIILIIKMVLLRFLV